MESTSGEPLLEPSALEVLKTELLPLASIVTPNLDEASILCGIRVDSIEKMKAAATGIHEMGPSNVLIKGGHLEGDCVDLFYDGHVFLTLPSPRINTRNTHGSGCTFSAAIATEIAKGFPAVEAVKRAKDFITTAIRFSLPMGSGQGPTNPYAAISRQTQIYQCQAELKLAFRKLQGDKIGHLIPEIQSNLGYATDSALSAEDVVAFPGRIIRLGDSIAKVSDPAAGASRHIAKIILAVLKYNKDYRSAMNIAWNPTVIACCKDLGFRIAQFDRKEEPVDIKNQEGRSLEWGTQKVLSHSSEVPDIIFDRGEVGKEPVIRVLGTDPMDVADKIIRISKETNQQC
jgi:hydroxymethylpyrimidine/phosphomethylpyrimidine kinase